MTGPGGGGAARGGGAPGAVSAWRSIEAESDGVMLRGRLYLPAGRRASGAPGVAPDRLPVVILVSGFTVTIPMVMDAYAEAFCGAGLAALAFDFRGLGVSDGAPRGEVNAWLQVRDVCRMVDVAAALPEVDGTRVGLWAESLGSVVAVVAAAVHGAPAALVLTIPAFGQEAGPADPEGVRFRAIREFAVSGQHRRPEAEWATLPVVTDDPAARPAVLAERTAFAWFTAHGDPPASGWSNRVVLTANRAAPPLDPFACLAQLEIPVAFVLSPADEMAVAAPAVTRVAFERYRGPKSLAEIDGGHFGLGWVGSEPYRQATTAAIDFLAGLGWCAPRSGGPTR